MTKVLIVDDDSLIRQTLAATLRARGLDVEEAENGKEGLKQALKTAPDLVITDVRMPEMDGVEMAEELRKDPKGRDVPIIILTNDEQAETLNEALEAGVTVYLSKSNVDGDVLPDQIIAALRRPGDDAPAVSQK